MIRALIDTDVILDFLNQRAPFLKEATAIWEANRLKQFEGYVAAITPINVFYISRKVRGQESAQSIIGDLLREWHICAINGDVLNKAFESPVDDFEDAVQHASADAEHLDLIVTRNITDYQKATIAVLTPHNFLTRLNTP